MIRYQWFRLSGSAALATAGFLFSCLCVVGGVSAQSVTADSVQSRLATNTFVVARSFPVAGALTSVATSDINQDGKLDLITTDYSSGKVTVFLGTGDGGFAPGVEYAAGAHPGSVVVADIDGNGKPGVIVSNESEGAISVLSGDGTGKLQPRRSYSVGFDAAFVAVGDFTGDGKADVAAVGRSGQSLAILLNDGKGNLKSSASYLLHKVPTALTVADFNHDGHADIALANADGTISLLLGSGGGSLHSTADIKVASGPLSSIIAGDFDNDGKVDLAVTQSGAKLLSVLTGKGDGGFAPAANYPVGNSPVSIVAVDVDGDGIPDLVAINQGSNSFSVLGGNGDGTFKASRDYVVGKGPLAAVAGDFDGDGRVDLAVINAASKTVSVPLGNGDGTFKAARAYSAEQQPKAIASGDLIGSGKSGLVVANYCGSDVSCAKGGSVAVFLPNEGGGYRLGSTYPVGTGPVSVALADVNGDKKLDVVALNRGDKTITVMLGSGDGTYQQPITFSLPEAPVAFAVGDFNKDGKPDLAVVGDCGSTKCTQPGTLDVLLGSGDGNFKSAASYPVDYSPTSIVVGDLDNDKNVDIVVANACGKDASCKEQGTASIFLGNAKGKFTAGPEVALGNSPSSIALADLSGRGVLDLMVSRLADNTLAVLHGKGDGSFQGPVAFKVGASPRSVVTADFNGDGKPDVAVANFADSTVSVLFGNGDGTLQSAFSLPVGEGPEALTAAAGSKSGHAALVTANGNSGGAVTGTDITALLNVHPEDSGSTTTVLTSTPNSVPLGTQITLTAVVSSSDPTAGVPAGSVEFMNGTADITGCEEVQLDESGTATCNTTFLTAGQFNIVANYSGFSEEFDGSTSNTVVEDVLPISSAIVFRVMPSNTTSVNTSVNFEASLDGASGFPVVPTGTMTFTINGIASSDCPPVKVSSGNAFCTTAALNAPSDTIKATYSGDTNVTADPASVTQTVTAVAATLALTSSVAPSSVNQPVTFTATLNTGTSPVSPLAPSGTVSFTINGNPSADCPAAKIAGGKATCTTKALLAGSPTIAATYSGDPNFTVAAPATLKQTVNPLTATMALTAAPAPSSVNQSVTFTATVTAASVAPTALSGIVSFTINGNASPDCPATKVDANGVATCTTSSLIAPADAITATYSGDSNFTVPNAVTIAQTVNKITAQTTLTSSSNPSSVNQAVTFRATVAGSSGSGVRPGGSVTFTEGSTHLCDSVTLTGNPSTASCTFAFNSSIPSPGTAITATYSGDTNFNAGAPGTLNQTVSTGGTVTAVTGTPNPSSVNQPVVFSATVASATSGTAKPSSGTVAFTDTSTVPSTILCTNTLTNGVVPTCTSVFHTAGPHAIVATFTSGDSSFSNSTSNPFSETVNTTATGTALTSTPNPSSVDQQVTFTATVTSAIAGTAVPAGTVTFADSISGALCTSVALKTGGTAACTAALSPAGPHNVVAAFTDTDGNFQSSVSPALTQTVGSTGAAVTLTATPNTSLVVNESVTFTATIAAAITGSTSPGGTVNFSYTLAGQTVVLCSAVQVATQGTTTSAGCQAPLSAAGSYSVIATYSGDKNFAGGSSTPLPLSVSKANTSVAFGAPPASPTVNQSVTLTAAVTAPAGTAKPTGTATFFDGALQLCDPATVTAGAAACTTAFGAVGNHSVTVIYSGDGNFLTSTSQALAVNVGQASTTLTLPATVPIAASQTAVFTATVNAPSGPATPGGSVTFTSADGSANGCVNIPVTSGTASCTATFPTSSNGPIAVQATYSGDQNFKGSTANVTQTVMNFSVAFTVQPSSGPATSGPVTITQGYANNKDPFNPVTVTANASTATGFTDSLTVICVVRDATNTVVTDPSCVPSSNTLPGNGSAPVTITLMPSVSAPIGSYTVTLIVTDSAVQTLLQSTTLTLNVTGVTGSLTLLAGSVGTENAIFNTGNPGTGTPATTLDTFSCPTVITVAGGDGNVANEITCTGPAAGVPVTGGQTTIPITITTKAPTTSSVERSQGSSSIVAAAFLGVPVLALIGWLGHRKSPRRNFFRFLGLILLAVGLGNAIGCGGGSFTPPPQPTGGIAPGNYLIQVVATDSSKPNSAKYYAVVPLVVNPN